MQCPECDKENALQQVDDVYRCQYCHSQFRLKEKTGYMDIGRHLKSFKSSLTTKEKALSLTKIAGTATANTALFGGSLIVNIAEHSLKHAGEVIKSKASGLTVHTRVTVTDDGQISLCRQCKATGRISCPMLQLQRRDSCPSDCPSCQGTNNVLCDSCYGTGHTDN